MKQKTAYYKTLQALNIARLCLLSEDARKPYPHSQPLNVCVLPAPQSTHPKNIWKTNDYERRKSQYAQRGLSNELQIPEHQIRWNSLRLLANFLMVILNLMMTNL